MGTETKARHAPEPWKISRVEGQGEALDYEISSGWNVIATVHNPDDAPEVEATAQVMAASPELLKTLKLVFGEWFEKPSNIEKIEPEWVRLARAAIAKAEPDA